MLLNNLVWTCSVVKVEVQYKHKTLLFVSFLVFVAVLLLGFICSFVDNIR